MSSTILIISDKQRRLPFGYRNEEPEHVKMLFAGSIAEAQEGIAGKAVDLTLIALKGQHEETFALVRQSLENNQETRVMFFANDKELNGTLSALAKLPPEQLKKLLSPQSTILPSADQARTIDVSAHTISGLFNEHELIGHSPEIEKLKGLILKIAPIGTTVMIQGESGTGKEVIARTLHNHSSRKNEVFIPIYCASINEKNIEGELFGHCKERFNEVDGKRVGLIRSADRGTLFLDEIDALPLAIQIKILQTIRDRTVQPVGSSCVYPVDIRIIAASSSNLAEAVNKGTFLQDLIDHLNAITLYAPPLRDRLDDIPLLCTYFINKLFYAGYPKKQISENAIAALSYYEWPGNIRELENVIRNAVTLCEGGVVERNDLSFSEQNNNADARSFACLAFHEREAIRNALKITCNNKEAAAELLGISETTLCNRMKMFHIERDRTSF
jgi:DNA-binding NtrC family response regulator